MNKSTSTITPPPSRSAASNAVATAENGLLFYALTQLIKKTDMPAFNKLLDGIAPENINLIASQSPPLLQQLFTKLHRVYSPTLRNYSTEMEFFDYNQARKEATAEIDFCEMGLKRLIELGADIEVNFGGNDNLIFSLTQLPLVNMSTGTGEVDRIAERKKNLYLDLAQCLIDKGVNIHASFPNFASDPVSLIRQAGLKNNKDFFNLILKNYNTAQDLKLFYEEIKDTNPLFLKPEYIDIVKTSMERAIVDEGVALKPNAPSTTHEKQFKI